jgi:2-polyprenyl-3-methyl-5-hydroxy-6-metoxy-1,4-benzoquinol methylase
LPHIETTIISSCNTCDSSKRTEIAKSPDFEYRTCSNEFTFGKCDDCGTVYLIDRPVPATLGTIYPDSYIPYSFNEHLGPVIAYARNVVQKKKVVPVKQYAPVGAVVVDVGSGSGEFLRILRDHGDKSWRLVGVDISEMAMEALRKINIEGVLGRFEALDWTLPAPDVIVMNQVIEHLDDPKAVVKRSFDLLRPGGVLMLETPSVDAWDAGIFKKRHWGGWHTPRHWVLYTPATLRRLADEAGFETVEVTHLLSPNFWLQSVHHKLSEGGPLARRLAKLFDVSNPVALPLATLIDVVQVKLTGKTSNFRLVARKPA